MLCVVVSVEMPACRCQHLGSTPSRGEPDYTKPIHWLDGHKEVISRDKGHRGFSV